MNPSKQLVKSPFKGSFRIASIQFGNAAESAEVNRQVPVHLHLHKPESDFAAVVLDKSAADSGCAKNDEYDVPEPDHQIDLKFACVLNKEYFC